MIVTKQPRGKALNGARAIAEYILNDPEKAEIVCALPRDEFGFIKLGRELVGYTGWIDAALAARARAASNRRRRAHMASPTTSSEASLK